VSDAYEGDEVVRKICTGCRAIRTLHDSYDYSEHTLCESKPKGRWRNVLRNDPEARIGIGGDKGGGE
jgi:hypothetical protein